jgi:hypothetical protein
VLHVDHIQPKAKGGKNDLLNLITSCEDCNLGKSDRLLSDASAVEKQKAQLDALNERREQLEMMIEWRSSLVGLDATAARGVCDLLYKCFGHEQGPSVVPGEIVVAVRKWGVEVCLEAAQRAAKAYTTVDYAVKKLGAICNVIHKSEQDPHYENIVRIRACLKKAGKYVNERCFSDVLRAALNRHVDVESLVRCAFECRNWTEFLRVVTQYIEDFDAGKFVKRNSEAS